MNTETQKAFAALDHELTGKPMRECETMARNQSRQDVWELQSNTYYLGDGGYTRLRIAEDFTVHLAMGARAEIEFNWLYADREIKTLNEALKMEALGITAQDIAETRNPVHYPENR